jgi:hypothetical protein
LLQARTNGIQVRRGVAEEDSKGLRRD